MQLNKTEAVDELELELDTADIDETIRVGDEITDGDKTAKVTKIYHKGLPESFGADYETFIKLDFADKTIEQTDVAIAAAIRDDEAEIVR